MNFIAEVCPCCGQTKDYALKVDQGTVDILKAIAMAVKEKGINCIHPRKEIEGKLLTSNQVGNLSRARFQGLIAKVDIDGKKGNYCLTRKGLGFLKGDSIPSIAVISKVEKRLMGYWREDQYRCVITDFKNRDEYWEGVNYHIESGKVVTDTKEFIKK